MLSILFKPDLIRHSGTRRAFKDTQRALEHLRHSESTRRALRGHSDTWRALGQLEGTWTLGGHLVTRALKTLEHSDT